MLKYLIVILNRNAPSFCYYENRKDKTGNQELMPMDTFKTVLDFALSKNLSINFLGVNKSLPDTYREEINQYKNHVKFISLENDDGDTDNILIINSSQKDMIKDIKTSSFRNIILRVEKEHLKDLFSIVQSFLYKCKRLNLCLLDASSYDMDDLKTYKSELDKTGNFLVSEYKAGNPVEFSFLTDRILLNKMNNCNAGIEHITVGTDGNFYICPGFFHNVENSAVGNLKDGIKILNQQLLQLDHAPICSICDAFHCKRCIYVNKLSTCEVNTPSYQQCALSHLERDTSRIMLTKLKEIEPFNVIPPIEELDYVDPLLVLTGKVKKKMPGEQPDGKISGKEKINLKDSFITVKDHDRIIKLPRLKQVIPGQDAGREEPGKQLKEQKIVRKQTGDELDTETVKGLLLEILKTQKRILAVLEKGSGGQ
ncbi:MAG: CXXX repeat peptide maturase [Spirochaetales bacterium]|nr:CXXX repeat peptide maturase [Spirochaetales bacterium]